MSGDRLIYLGTMQEMHDLIGADDHGSTVSDLEEKILRELSGVPGDHQIYLSSNKIEDDNEEDDDCHHGVTKRIASRLAHEGYPPTKKCVDCGLVSHMVWGPWLKPIKQP